MNIVKNARKELKITQKKLARNWNVKQSYISQLENYKKTPGNKLLIRISQNLRICPIVILQKYLCKNCKIKKGCDTQIIIIKK